jgi:FkbM family methyltransferase
MRFSHLIEIGSAGSGNVSRNICVKTEMSNRKVIMNTIIRLMRRLDRLTTCLRYLNLRTTLELFLLRNVPATPRRAVLRNRQTPFFYRGYADCGVMSHFYIEGYEIVSASTEVKWIIDLGANIGDETVKFALRHPKASILAIEPEGENFKLLVANSKVFSPRIFPLHCGIWWRDARLNIRPGPTNESFTVEEAPAGSIKGRCIRSLMNEFGIEQIDILKIDIEGAEFELFKDGVEDWLPAVRSVVIEISDHERAGSMQNFFRAFEKLELKFDFFICGENLVGLSQNGGLEFKKSTGI